MTELVLPMVIRIERDEPPQRSAALEAAAIGTLRMLATDRPEWRAAVDAWDGQRIRKVVRRARGAGWQRARALPGLDVVHNNAELRVYPPVPVDDWPTDLARLQVGGTNLVDHFFPNRALGYAPLILLSPHVEMTTGKKMAQVAHAAHLWWRASTPHYRRTWQTNGFWLGVRDATPQRWREAIEAGAVVVHDGGFTEVEPGTATALITHGR